MLFFILFISLLILFINSINLFFCILLFFKSIKQSLNSFFNNNFIDVISLFNLIFCLFKSSIITSLVLDLISLINLFFFFFF